MRKQTSSSEGSKLIETFVGLLNSLINQILDFTPPRTQSATITLNLCIQQLLELFPIGSEDILKAKNRSAGSHFVAANAGSGGAFLDI
jgi:hypothetical protein